MDEDQIAKKLLQLRKDFFIAKRNITWLSINLDMRHTAKADDESTSFVEVVYAVYLSVDKGDQVCVRCTDVGYALEEAYRRAQFDARSDVR